MNVTPQPGQNESDQKNNNLQWDENINPGFISAFEILNSAIPEQSFLIENILPAETICLLSGPSDTGKSILARQIAISVALGREDVAGFKLTCKYKKAMYISTEDGKRDWKSKLNKYSLPVEEQQLLKNLTLVFDIEHYSVKELEKRLKANPVDVVVFDVFTDIFGKDLNNAIQVREFLADYKRLVKQYGCTIIFVHHLSKKGELSAPSKINVLGSQSIESAMRCVLELRPDSDENYRNLVITKANYISPSQKKKARRLLLKSTLELEYTGTTMPLVSIYKPKLVVTKEMEERVIELHNQGKTLREIESVCEQENIPLRKTKIGEIINQYKGNKPADDNDDELSVAS